MHELIALLMICTFLGSAAGALAAALGVGASLVFVPVLLLVVPQLGVPPQLVPAVAVATSLTASCAVTISAVVAHLRAGNLQLEQLRQARVLLLWAAIGGALGGLTISHNDSTGATLALALAQIVVAFVLATRGQMPARSAAAPALTEAPTDRPTGRPSGIPADAQARAYVGVVGGLTSIGAGGVFLAPYFLWRGMPRVQAAALASLIGVAITPVATAVFLAGRPIDSPAGTFGYVHLPLAVSLAVGSLYGTRVGAGIAKSAHGRTWSRALALLLLLSSARAIARIV